MDLEKEESIDLGRLWQVAKARKKVVGGIIVGCTILAAVISLLLPKQYESTTLVQTRDANKAMSGQAAMALLGGGSGVASPTTNYMELMKSRTVLEPIIDAMDWEDPKKKPDAKAFAKSYLDIKNTKQTNLIEVTAKGKTPEEAQQISQSVVDNFLAMQTNNQQQTQSLLVKFLNDRIEEAKKDSDEAAQKFADYQREHKMYSPDEEAKVTVQKLKGYDDAMKDLKVAEATTQAKLGVVNEKLGDIAGASKAYNINDNANVQNIRGKIIAAEVDLAGLREHYTDRHPTVIAAQQRLAELRQALTNEVDTVVDSNTTSLNPVQAGLMKEKAESEAGLAAAKASEEAIQKRRAEVEDHLTDFPQEVIEYLQLQREASIKTEIYTNLVKQCEQNKLQEAMEAMDIQVIDPANLPDEDKPSFPRKKLITAIGLVLGCMISFSYTLVMYKREA